MPETPAPTVPTDADSIHELSSVLRDALQQRDSQIEKLESMVREMSQQLSEVRAMIPVTVTAQVVAAEAPQALASAGAPAANAADLFQLAVSYTQQAKYPQAIDAWQRCIELDPDNLIARINYAHVLLESGKWRDSADAFEAAIKMGPNEAEPYFGLGMAAGHLGSYARSEAAFRMAIELDPSHTSAIINLGVIYDKLGRWEEARETFEHAIRLQPDEAYARLGLGTALRNLGRGAEAIDVLRRASELQPDSVDAHYFLGTLHLEADRLDEAAAAFQRVRQLQPEHEGAHVSLQAVADRQRKQAAAAARDAERAEVPISEAPAEAAEPSSGTWEQFSAPGGAAAAPAAEPAQETPPAAVTAPPEAAPEPLFVGEVSDLDDSDATGTPVPLGDLPAVSVPLAAEREAAQSSPAAASAGRRKPAAPTKPKRKAGPVFAGVGLAAAAAVAGVIWMNREGTGQEENMPPRMRPLKIASATHGAPYPSPAATVPPPVTPAPIGSQAGGARPLPPGGMPKQALPAAGAGITTPRPATPVRTNVAGLAPNAHPYEVSGGLKGYPTTLPLRKPNHTTLPPKIENPGTTNGFRKPADEPSQVTVYLSGEVHKPGPYIVERGARVADVLLKAGGTTSAADLSSLYLIGKVSDGQRITVPSTPAETGGAVPAAPPTAKPQ